jgi:predicted unusual protein kinase regulating ubiquinone biosynthesis (AarF/ABC1/UbiB family)
MWCILFSEAFRYAWTRDYPEFVRRASTRLMHENVVYTKVFQAIVAKYAPCDAHNIPYPPDEVAPALSPGLTCGGVVGTGMIAVVFAGEADGVPVVIKVKRKNILAELTAGLARAQSTMRTLNRLPWLRRYCLPDVYLEVKELLLEQLDFEQEAFNQNRFRDMFAYNPKVVVPKLFPKWCTPDQLVMERLEGLPLAEVDHPACAELFSQIIAKSTVLDGFVHSDMHLGNVFFLKDGRIGIIDYGLMVELTGEQQDAYLVLSKALSAQDYAAAAAHVLTTYFTCLAPSPRKAALLLEIAEIFRRAALGKTFGVMQVSEMASAAYPYGYKVSTFFYKIVMSMAASDALLQELTPKSLDLLLHNISAFTE